MFDLNNYILSTQATAELRGPSAASLAMRHNIINTPASSLSSLVGHASNSVASYLWYINGIFDRSGPIAVFLVVGSLRSVYLYSLPTSKAALIKVTLSYFNASKCDYFK